MSKKFSNDNSTATRKYFKFFQSPIMSQNIDNECLLLINKLGKISINYNNLNIAFDILKNFRANKFKYYVIGRKINEMLRNEPNVLKQFNIVLIGKKDIAKIMFEAKRGKNEEDEIPEEEIFEWLRCMELGLLYAVKFFNIRSL